MVGHHPVAAPHGRRRVAGSLRGAARCGKSRLPADLRWRVGERGAPLPRVRPCAEVWQMTRGRSAAPHGGDSPHGKSRHLGMQVSEPCARMAVDECRFDTGPPFKRRRSERLDLPLEDCHSLGVARRAGFERLHPFSVMYQSGRHRRLDPYPHEAYRGARGRHFAGGQTAPRADDEPRPETGLRGGS